MQWRPAPMLSSGCSDRGISAAFNTCIQTDVSARGAAEELSFGRMSSGNLLGGRATPTQRLFHPTMKPLPRLFVPFLLLSGIAVVAAPVARWDFGEEDTSRAVVVGTVQRDAPGPRPPQFPDFDSYNTALRLDGNGGHLALTDPGAGSVLDFSNGDAITLEAWVQVDGFKANDQLYVVGKGRTGASGFAADNQNWALRVRAVGGQFGVNFLFATPRGTAAAATTAASMGKSDAHWHRWTSQSGFAPDSGWHHIAVTYRFGEPASIRGWIDGKMVAGAWDMGGATTEAPVVDDDAVWVGSSMKASKAASFRGGLDAVAIHREIVSDADLKARFRRVGGGTVAPLAPVVMPDLGPLPAGRVVAMFHEGMPAQDRWLNAVEKLPGETLRWTGREFLLPRLPLRYDDWGIRASWKGPVLTRLAADVTLPPASIAWSCAPAVSAASGWMGCSSRARSRRRATPVVTIRSRRCRRLRSPA